MGEEKMEQEGKKGKLVQEEAGNEEDEEKGRR